MRRRLFLSLVLAWAAVGVAEGQNTRQSKAALRPSNTQLDVKQFSGEFQQWTKTLTIDSRPTLTFRWSTTEPRAALGSWVISDQTPGSRGAKVVATGTLARVPSKGQSDLFQVDFASFLPQTASGARSYWVVVVAKDGQQNELGKPSVPVKVTYTAPASAVTFTTKGLDPQLFVPMPVVVDLQSLNVINADEDGEGDEPYLLVAVIYADGTTINPADFPNSSIRIDSAQAVHNNVPHKNHYGNPLKSNTWAAVPDATGRFEKTILPIGLEFVDVAGPELLKNSTRIWILVVAMEEDGTSDKAAMAARNALINGLQKEVNAAVRSMQLGQVSAAPDIAAIQARLQTEVLGAAKAETFSFMDPANAMLALDDVIDPDDLVGVAVAHISYNQILKAGKQGVPVQMSFKKSGIQYALTGKVRYKAESWQPPAK